MKTSDSVALSGQKLSPDWLPAGWTAELKVRKNGKKDKCYTDPSNEFKFYSKPEVLRYLKALQCNRPKSEEKNKGTTERFEINSVVEKAVPEELPPGWITEMRERKTGRITRKDLYYTDPVSGYVFRSLKDAHRYLKTGDLGRLAFKPKDKDHINVELEDDPSCTVPEGQKLADCGTHRQIIGNQSSELAEIVKDEQILESTCAADPVCLPEHASDQSREGAAVNSVNLPEAEGVEQREGKSESTVHKFISATVTEKAFPEKPPLENGVERPGNIRLGTKKSKGKGEPGIPRRASKRLAGIDVDPAMELKTNSRTRRVAARRSSESEVSSAENFGELANPEEHAGNIETENVTSEKQELPVVLLPPSLPMTEEPAGPVAVKPGSPTNLSLTDLWTDPCIEFAIKTLTGAIPIGNEDRTYDNPGSPLDLPLGELWKDPCIEFAVKTLTGDIPVEDDLDIRDYFQQHVSSSETQERNDLTLPNVGLNNFCPSDLSSQHFVATEKPLYKQQDLIAPMLPHTGNVSLQNSGDHGLHRHAEGRSGECSRSRVQ